MVKLVEEVVISSDVLVDVLVQVGFLDKAFEDGNVSRIDSSYGREGANTYSITVEKEVSLDSVKGEKEECIHDKVFDYSVQLSTNPPQYKWKCAKCGETGNDFLSGGNKKIKTGSGYMNAFVLNSSDKILNKKDTEKLISNVDISDKKVSSIDLSKLKNYQNPYDLVEDIIKGLYEGDDK